MTWSWMCWLPVVVALLVAAAGVRAAGPDSLALSETVDARLGLFDDTLRIWKIPRRYTAGGSPYFRPGLPPYRQQPEKAEDQVPVEPEQQVVVAPRPSGSTAGGASSNGGSSNDAPAGDGGSDASAGGSTGSGGGSGDSGGDIEVPEFGPTPCFC